MSNKFSWCWTLPFVSAQTRAFSRSNYTTRPSKLVALRPNIYRSSQNTFTCACASSLLSNCWVSLDCGRSRTFSCPENIRHLLRDCFFVLCELHFTRFGYRDGFHRKTVFPKLICSELSCWTNLSLRSTVSFVFWVNSFKARSQLLTICYWHAVFRSKYFEYSLWYSISCFASSWLM